MDQEIVDIDSSGQWQNLYNMDKRKDPAAVDIQRVLLDLREYRMGLIQTPDQLRFSYMAVIQGAKRLMGDCSVQSQLSSEDRETVCEVSLAPLCPRRPLEKPDGRPQAPSGSTAEETTSRRRREERLASTAQKVQMMKQRLSDSERHREQWLYWRPVLLNVGAGAALAVGLLACWFFSS